MNPVNIGTLFFGNNNAYSGTIIKPVDNVNGAVIRTGIYSGSVYSLLTTGTAAPTGISDNTKPQIGRITTNAMFVQIPYPIYLPAGYGLWFYGNSSAMPCSFTYDLL